MQVIDKLMMFIVAVSDMPKAKEFYGDKLGLKVVKDYRQDDDHWWVSLTLPEGGVTITLSTHHEHMKPGTMTIYFATSDVAAAHKDLSNKGVKVTVNIDNSKDLIRPAHSLLLKNEIPEPETGK
jgi:predicted enzyme related to lactoylglutathione lyase